MKCSLIPVIVLLLPFFAQVPALTVPGSLSVRAFGGGRTGGNSFGKGGSGRGGGAKSSTASVASSTPVAASTIASTTTTSSAAAAATGTNSTATGTNSTAAAGGNSGDPQQSLTLDPRVIATGFENNGQNVPTAGQVASLTSSNNFINFCLTVPNLPLTNGKQITTGSCNPAPMGVIASSANMPSAKFTNPKNGDIIPANKGFTITMAVSNFQTGSFANAEENYFSAPQQVNGQGQVIGHSHAVVELLTALDQTTPTDPTKFAFFKGMNTPAVNGILSADVTNGLPAGVYKVSSINSATNHQPILVAIAQHGSLDDAVYFTVTDGGAAAAGASNATATAGAASEASSATAAVGAASGASNATSSASPAAASVAASSTATAAPGKKGGKTGKGKFGRSL